MQHRPSPTPRRRSPRFALAAATAALAGSALAAAPAGAAVGFLGATADDGAKVIKETRIGTRQVDLTIQSPALKKTGMVRVDLPPSWGKSKTRRYPALYLHHGANEPADYKSWSSYTEVDEWSSNKEMLVVMPSGGGAGFFTKEWNYGMPGGIDYDTFHNKEVTQLIERGYHGSKVRGIGGLSMGGFGAMSYAARYPRFYKVATSYSGLVDTLLPGSSLVVDLVRIRDNKDPFTLWGSPKENRAEWEKWNPVSQAEGLRGTKLFISVGNGQAGPFDAGKVTIPIEAPAQEANRSLRKKLEELKIPATYDFYGPGFHNWPYWNREIKRSWPIIAKALGLPVGTDPTDPGV